MTLQFLQIKADFIVRILHTNDTEPMSNNKGIKYNVKDNISYFTVMSW